MSVSEGRLAQFVLRWSSALAGLRRVPMVGRFVHWAGGKILPHDSLAWAKIQQGLARGLWLRLHPRTGKSYFEGNIEPEVQAALQRHLRPGMTFYDIGANIGFFSLLAARLVGKNGKVVAFEADPEVATRLRENVARNSMNWVAVEEKAVWSEPGTVCFSRAAPEISPDRGLGHVVSTSTPETIDVRAVALDGYTSMNPAPDFLKCDAEGAEVEVFHGAHRLLREKRPCVICEMHSEENASLLRDEFARLNYDCTSLGKNHLLALPQ